MEEPNSAVEDMVEDKQVPNLEIKVNYEAKLNELLHRINSIEIKLCSDAAKEFIKLLKGSSGGELLRHYVTSSSQCSELLGAWKLRQGKTGISHVFKLISAILNHPEGIYRPNSKNGITISRVLDKFARSIIESHLQDVYKEINGKELRSQKAALLLMASIVRRGSVLASEVAKSFDFKLKGFAKLTAIKKKRDEKNKIKNKRANRSPRKAFVKFAMSFLEVGKPGLLRWILQQREMYSGVLRSLGSEEGEEEEEDEDEIVALVLSTLRDKVLVEESLVPPGLRSVLFGSATLERLVEISGRENGTYASDLAYNVLVLVCTDPSNGLMPDLTRRPSPLRGNQRRLLGLMNKLKATDSAYHRDLLLAIVCGRPALGAAYMEGFPYSLEDFMSPNWFAIMNLAANLLSSVRKGLDFDSVVSHHHDPSSEISASIESLMKCSFPRSFSQSGITRGLLHSDFLVKHGTLRLLLEVLKFLDSLISSLDSQIGSQSSYVSLKQEILDEIRTSIPDPQVLVTLLSSLSSQSKTRDTSLKRKAESESSTEGGKNGGKRLKKEKLDKDSDIVIGGISDSMDIAVHEDSEKVGKTTEADDLDDVKEFENVLHDIWGSALCAEEADIYFQSKLLDALKTYFKVMPAELEKLFMFLTKLLKDPLALHTNLQKSLLSYLVEYVGWSPTGIPISVPPLMYKHLQSFINLLILSPISDVKSKAYYLSRAAMLSTGAFDRNHHEIGSWFLFLPGYDRRTFSSHVQGLESFQSCQVVNFFCDAVSTMGNSLFKYWDIVRSQTLKSKDLKDVSLGFSPLVVCILQKCLRLLDSKSETCSPEKSMISLYVSNTLKYILQTQVEARLLASVIDSILSERLGETNSAPLLGEWIPLKNLALFTRNILQSQTCKFTDKKAILDDGSLELALSEIESSLDGVHGSETGEIINAFSSSLIRAMPEEIVNRFPSVLTTSQKLPGVLAYLMPSVLFLQQGLLNCVSHSCPEIYIDGLEMAVSRTCYEDGKDAALVVQKEMGNRDFSLKEDGSAAEIFSLILEETPLHVLLPSIMIIDGPYSSEPAKMKQLLLAKLSEWKFDHSHISYLSLLLFWVHQIQSSNRVDPSTKLEELSEICFILLKDLLVQLFESQARNLSTQEIQEVVRTIFCHPVVVTSISHPLSCHTGFAKSNSADELEAVINSSQGVHKLDQHIWDILGTTTELLFSLCDDPTLNIKAESGASKNLLKVFNSLTQRVVSEVKEQFKEGILSGDLMLLLPPYHALQAVIRSISPFELLALVKWVFEEVEIEKYTNQESSKMSAASFGIRIAIEAFRNLSFYLMQPLSKRRMYDMFWKIEEFKDFNIIEEIYVHVTRLALTFETDYVNVCLLEFVNAAQRQNHMLHHNFHRLTLVLSGIVSKTSVEMVSHCIHRTSRTKAKLLYLITDLSSIHLSKFGDLFLHILDSGLLQRGKMVDENNSQITLSDDDYMMLLPASLSYVNYAFSKFGTKYYENFKSIPSFYSTIIIKGFSQWKSFAYSEMFEEQYGNFLPQSCQELLHLVHDSLLGKSIQILQSHFSFEGDSMKTKTRLKLFISIFPISSIDDDLIDCDISALESFSLSQMLNHINRLVAKISFCRMLLFPTSSRKKSLPKEDQDLKDTTKKECSRMHFVKVLVDIWQLIIQKFPLVSNNSGKSTCHFSLYRYLEDFVLRSVLELATELRGILVQQENIPFLEQLTKSALRYRYEDPKSLKVLQEIITVLAKGKFGREFYLQLLLAHSQFESTILSVSASKRSCGIGVVLKPMPGILRYISFRSAHENTSATDSNPYLKQLGVIKLLRTLFSFESDQSALEFGNTLGIKFRTLHLLLLSSYGATLSALDLEIYNLLSAIESIDGVEADNICGLDYLWGNAASKIEKEQVLERDTANIMNDAEAIRERRRSQFRDNLPIDPKICASTVLYFPYDRTSSQKQVPFDKFQSGTFASSLEVVGDPERYDPVFILRFSLYCLSVGYIEPMEFAGLGLLAVAFVSISSPDEGIRKLAYSTLEKFKNALEQCKKKKKDVTHIRLLLTSLQNGIDEPWQKVPSVVAVFAAEASFILLDSSHDHYATLSRHLMNLSKMSMKNVPVFNECFWSVSVNFKAERLWILRLLYVGLNSDDDAHIYIRNSILETLMGFYFSPLSDNESNRLILQVVKKSIKSYKLTRHLIENCGLFSWLSSVLLISNKTSSAEEKEFSIGQLTLLLEIVNDAISLRSVNEWLQREALEQLTELSSHLYRLLVDGVVSVKEHAKMVDLILEIIASTLKLSHKRKTYQPHFNISVDGLFRICKITSEEYGSVNCGNTFEFGLKAVLMSIPSSEILSLGQEKLQTFLLWAISSALRAESAKSPRNKTSGEEQLDESLVSKLLRWLSASVILGSLAKRSDGSDLKTGSSLKDLMSALVQEKSSSQDRVGSKEFLASAILFLQQLVTTNYALPSVVSALSILLHNASTSDGLHSHLNSLWSKVRCVAEANPSWRWTYYQAWKDHTLGQSDPQKIEEINACRAILFLVSNSLGSTGSQSLLGLSVEDVQKVTSFEWENRILVEECNED